MRNTILIGLFFLLIGCSGGGDDFLDSPVTNQTLLSITEAGAGPINQRTPFSTKAIEAALPGFTANRIRTAVELNTVWTIAAFSNGKQVIQVFRGGGGTVGEVHGVTQHLIGPAGERIGMTFKQIGPQSADCRVGTNLWRGMAICPSRGAANVALVFAVAKYEGPYDRLPPEDLLNDATLQRIVWKPAEG